MGMMDWSFIVFLVFGLFETMVAKGEGRFLCLVGKNCDNKKKAPRLRAGHFVLSLLTRGDGPFW